MVIVSIKQSSSDRLVVTLEDGSELKCTLGVVTAMRLFQGRELDEAEISELKRASSLALARERALELLSRRPFSRKELTDKLIKKGEEPEIADACALWLEENGFLNDERYAASVARHYAAKGFGAGRVRSELYKRGVDRELWDDTVSAMPDSGDKIDKLISSKLKDPSDRDELRKIGAALYRRGFSWDEIRAAMNRIGSDGLEDE